MPIDHNHFKERGQWKLDIIKSTIKVGGKKQKCTFKLALRAKTVDLKKSKLSCSPRMKWLRGKKLENLKLSGKHASYIVSIKIYPSKVITAGIKVCILRFVHYFHIKK